MLSGLCGDPPRSLGTSSVLLTWPMSVSMGCLWFPPPLLIHMEKPLPCYNDSTLPTESRHYMAQYSNSSQCFPSLHSFPLCSHSAHIPKMAPAPNILYFSHTHVIAQIIPSLLLLLTTPIHLLCIWKRILFFLLYSILPKRRKMPTSLWQTPFRWHCTKPHHSWLSQNQKGLWQLTWLWWASCPLGFFVFSFSEWSCLKRDVSDVPQNRNTSLFFPSLRLLQIF